MRTTNPLFGDQPFKFGIFAYLHEGGMTLTKAPERWPARWPDIVNLAKMSDEGGLDFMLPISSWNGWKGEIEHRRYSFETLTHAAALSGVTKRIALMATVHTPLIHPIFVAKALATIDHATGGRTGLNIVCGWQPGDFKMFGVEQLVDHDARYAQGQEWFDILSKLLGGVSEPFDYRGKYFNCEGLNAQPGSVQQPYPAILNAAFSPIGRDFAVRNADFLLTIITNMANAEKEMTDIRERAAAAGRKMPLGVISTATLVCRETRKEAEEFNRYYALEQADNLAIDQYTDARSKMASSPTFASVEAMRMRAAGGGTLIGTPEDIVEGFLKMKKAGVSGAAMHLLNPGNDLPFILERVVPLMKQAGLRH